jgi:hypothetical protein
MKIAYSLFFVICLILASCSDEEVIREKENVQCSTPAIIRDYAGLDGCGYVLELPDGTIVEPVKLIVCGPPPHSVMTIEDPLHNYHIDGLNVSVAFEAYEGGSVCMAGELVKITCISTVGPPTAAE